MDRGRLKITDTMICAGREEGILDACAGDSGGPAWVGSGASAVQVGVVSFGIGCGRPHRYGVYTNVAHFASWIDAHIDNNTNNTGVNANASSCGSDAPPPSTTPLSPGNGSAGGDGTGSNSSDPGTSLMDWILQQLFLMHMYSAQAEQQQVGVW